MKHSGQKTTVTPQDAPTVDALLQDCHRLLNQVAKRPNAIKHLRYLHQAIGLFAAYKAGRRARSPIQRHEKPQNDARVTQNDAI